MQIASAIHRYEHTHTRAHTTSAHKHTYKQQLLTCRLAASNWMGEQPAAASQRLFCWHWQTCTNANGLIDICRWVARCTHLKHSGFGLGRGNITNAFERILMRTICFRTESSQMPFVAKSSHNILIIISTSFTFSYVCLFMLMLVVM